jgi:putative ABC transport system permease protein
VVVGGIETLRQAIATVAAHPLRSCLAVAGVMFGTACVVSTAALLTGMEHRILSDLRAFGAETLFVLKFDGGVRVERPSVAERTRRPIRFEDFEAVRDHCPALLRVTAVVVDTTFRPEMPFKQVRHGREAFHGAEVSGALPDYADALNMPVRAGRFFTAFENLHRRAVCVIGDDVARTLFPRAEPVGQRISTDGHLYEVVGVFQRRRTAAAFGDDSRDAQVVMPYLTFRKAYPLSQEHFLVGRARPGELGSAVDQVRVALRRSRRNAPGQPDTFGITTARSVIDEFEKITAAIAFVIAILSSFGLLVSGVGVMNIMLASVGERTREIGTRMAVGARRRDILLQFLAEAMALTGGGGACGIAAAWVTGEALNRWVPSLRAGRWRWGSASRCPSGSCSACGRPGGRRAWIRWRR